MNVQKTFCGAQSRFAAAAAKKRKTKNQETEKIQNGRSEKYLCKDLSERTAAGRQAHGRAVLGEHGRARRDGLFPRDGGGERRLARNAHSVP